MKWSRTFSWMPPAASSGKGRWPAEKYWNVGVAKGGEVGRGAETWKPGHWHKWEVALSYGVLLILMDGEVVAQQELTTPEIHHFQLRPWRNAMDVAGLSVDYAVSTMKVRAISDDTWPEPFRIM